MEDFFASILPKAEGMALNVLGALLALGAGVLFVGVLVRLLKKNLPKARINHASHRMIISLTRIILYTILAIVIMQILHIPTTPIVTAIGAAGLAVGLALKDSLSSFAAGIIMIFHGHIKKGDVVQIDQEVGIVEEIGLMFTTLFTPDNRCVTLPNSSVINLKIINHSTQALRRLDLTFSVSYDTNIALAKQTILAVIARHGDIFLDPPQAPEEPFVGVNAYGASGIEMVLKVWFVNGPGLYTQHKFMLMEEVKAAFDAAGIQIPYDQLDVHLVK